VSIEPGVLYVVATPIGNLEDITLRALQVLAGVDLILAEDTRVSGRLLQRFAITTPVRAFHEHNERKITSWVIERLEANASVALISDAGTPLLSDPGFYLTRLLRAQNKKIVPIPGPSALVCGLSVAGLPTDRFVFEGFLPAKREARRHRLRELEREYQTLVLYEAPHRVLATVADLVEIFGRERQAVIARELTKTFETIRSDSLPALEGWLQEDGNHQRGEFVLMVEGRPKTGPGQDQDEVTEEELRTLHLLLEELSLKKAVALAVRLTGQNKNTLYRLALQAQDRA